MKDEKSPASVGYRLAKLLKHLDNRLCADCGMSLLEWQNYYGSLTHQVWLCNTCFESHVEVLGEDVANGKRIKEEWTDEEVTLMEKAGSNVIRNKLYERYTHPDWKKITQESPYTERIQYIKAKYLSKYFTIPPLPTTIHGKKHAAHDIGYSSTLPMRTADYFVTLGMGKAKGKVGTGKSVTDTLFNVEVLSSFPNEKFYTDHPSPIPDLLGPMVFPKGLRLSKREERPYSFTFVLTDTYRVKQFGAVLIVHELLDPRALQTLMSQRRYSVAMREDPEHQAKDVDEGNVLYAPKALVILSHYPFFHLFTRFLEQIYHLSLSSSPLPIERYIANFLLELPLPPQGRIEVLFSLPESQLQISRPPRNQLPMVDFSYRPLFAHLSVDNILAVFACLCQEMSVCICSKNIALLTPVQEALLSLLFPFVWQGCYVPVLPADMVELLHAPVPLLTGMQVSDISETFLDEDPSMRPAGLVIVHLESDTVHYGSECNPLPLPKAMLPKLRQKLIEHGSAIHQLPEELVLLQNAELLYPNDEHMRPMKNFIAAQGVLSSIHPTRGAPSVDRTNPGQPPARRLSNFMSGNGSVRQSGDGADDASESGSTVNGSVAGSKRGGFGLRGFYSAPAPKPAKDQKYQHVSAHHHPAACSLDASSRTQSNAAYFATRRYALDPAYNYQPDISQAHQLPPGAIDFNAMEIRGAFLRFFVAAFQNYEEFFSDYAQRQKDALNEKAAAKKAGFGFQSSKSADNTNKFVPLSKQSLDSTSRPKLDSLESNPHSVAGVMTLLGERRTFDQKKFLSIQDDTFLKHMISSQMFANFTSEIIEEPNQPEIRFFNEHIIAKRNRSKLALTKASTPFLDDPSEDIAQSFTVPGPVTASVPQGQTFSYTAAFPVPDLRQLQVVVTERGLQETGGAGGYLVREIGHGPEVSRLQRGEDPQVMRDRVRLQFGPSMTLPSSGVNVSASLTTLRRTMIGVEDGEPDPYNDPAESDDGQEENEFFLAARRRFEAVVRGITRLQACWRARPAKRQYRRKFLARRVLQRWWHKASLRREIRRRVHVRAVRRLQGVLRFLLCRREYIRNLRRVRVLQSLFRARRGRVVFKRMRARCQRVQAWFRGNRTRRALRKKTIAQWTQWRRQLQYLWTADNTPLKYRSSFWTLLNNYSSFVTQALHQQELRRLYDNLALIGPAGIPKAATFEEQFRASLNTPMVLKLSALHSSQQLTAAEISAQTVTLVDEAMRGSAKLFLVAEQRRAVAAERKQLYTSLQGEQNNEALFRLFSLQDLKKRKQKLSDLVWVCCSDEYAAKSAAAVVAINNNGTLPTADAQSKAATPNPLALAAKAHVTAGAADWPQILRERRIAFNCAETAKAYASVAQRQDTSKGSPKSPKKPAPKSSRK